MILIQTNNLTKRYSENAEEIPAVSDVSLQVSQGEFVAIVGPSGSGKSTLISLIGSLIHPSEGDVIIDDIDVFLLGQDRLSDFRREYIGFVFQSFNLVPYLNVFENILLPLTVIGISIEQKREMAKTILSKVGLENKILRLPGELSGGEQERVAIARALVNKPPIVLADEPTGNLDFETGKNIMNLFRELNNDGQTILMVTHNDSFQKYAQRSILINDGNVMQN